MFGAAWFPLRHLTTPPTPVATVESPQPERLVEGTALPLYVELRFSHPPAAVSLGFSGEAPAVVFDVSGEEQRFHADLEALLPEDAPLDLIVAASWPGELDETAVRVLVEPEGLAAYEETIWSRGDLDAVVTFDPFAQ